MASETTTRIVEIQIDYEKAVKGVADLTKGLKELTIEERSLQKEIDNQNGATDEQLNRLAAIKAAQADDKAQIRDLNKEIQNGIKATREREGSLSSLRAQLSNTTKEYDNLSRAEREGGKGLELKNKINSITDELKGAEEETQRFYRNVGNYDEIVGKAISSNVPFIGQIQQLVQTSGGAGAAVKSLGSTVTGLGKSFFALLANPVFLVLAGLATIISAVTKAINTSEDASNRWSAVLSPLSRILSFLLSVLQQAAGVILSVVEGAGKLFGWVMKLAEGLPIVGGTIKEINAANREAIALAKEKADIEEQARVDEVANAKDALRVAELRKQAKDKENQTAEQRLAAVKEAGKIEEQTSKRNVELAERRYEALKKESEWAENNAETNAELAKLEAGMFNARREYFAKTMELQEQENTTRSEIAAEEKARNEKAIASAKERIDKELSAVREMLDAKIALMEDGIAKDRELADENHRRKIEDLNKRLNTEKNLTTKTKEAITQQIEIAEKQHEANMAQLKEKALADRINKEAEIIALKLAAIKKGSDEELQLRLDQLQKQQEAELNNANLTAEQKLLIEAKYRADADALRDQHTNDQIQKSQNAVHLEWENKINEAALQGQNTLQLELQQRAAELAALQQMEGESDAAFKARQLEAYAAHVDAKKAITDYEVEVEQAKMQSIEMITGSLGGLLEEMGENNKAFAIASKALALGEIAINTGKAIAAGTAQAQSVPFPGNLLAIATTVATVIANVTTAIKTVKSAKFATGGYVEGPGTETSDSIPARLSRGESVNNAMSTSMFTPIYSALNQMGGGVPIVASQTGSQIAGEDMLARAFTKGIAGLNLRLGIDEIHRVESRVSTIETLGDL